MGPQRFDRFADLPRELQLQIWDIHERDNFVHVQHYFRRMRTVDARLYAAADLDTGRSVLRPLLEHSPTPLQRTPFAAPRTSILLPGREHFRNVNPRPAIYTFNLTLTQEPAPHAFSTSTNFKHDSFCFVTSEEHRDVLDYFAARWDEGVVFPQLAPWFFRIRHLVLAPRKHQPCLSSFDRWFLAKHPSLQSITIVSEASEALGCYCPARSRASVPIERSHVKRISLETFLFQLGGATRCGCVAEHVTSLERMRDDLLSLVSKRERKLRLSVLIEVER